MRARSRIFVVTWMLATAPALAFAQAESRTERVSFTDGHATVKGRIRGYGYVDYFFPAGAGESLSASLKTNSNSCYFNLLAPGETETAFFIGSIRGANYAGVAPTSGDYTARVYLMRSAARRRETANYALTIALGEKRAHDKKGADYADGLTGGPDYWEVAGVNAQDMLSLRAEPSTHAQIVGRLANGAVLRNLGCNYARGQRWCRVEGAGGSSLRGWVNGRYLREFAAHR